MTARPPSRSPGPPDEANPASPATSGGWLSGQSTFGHPDERQARRALTATLATAGLHGLLLLGLVLMFGYRREIRQAVIDKTPLTFVYIQQAGPRGGGGGSPAPAPRKPLSVPRTEPPVPVPVAPPPPTVTPPPPAPTLSAPLMTASRDLVQATGTSSVSLAAYGGNGLGTGLGPGTGSGVGPGSEAGFGGGLHRPGAGIQEPILLKEQRPTYTSDAMRAKIQGVVRLEAVVDENGLVNDVRVIRSLDTQYGLDQEAVKAARRWLFRPARDRDNKPVPIIISLELTFALH